MDVDWKSKEENWKSTIPLVRTELHSAHFANSYILKGIMRFDTTTVADYVNYVNAGQTVNLIGAHASMSRTNNTMSSVSVSIQTTTGNCIGLQTKQPI
jgi:hypothetical protein